jgi:hypothetical protein
MAEVLKSTASNIFSLLSPSSATPAAAAFKYIFVSDKNIWENKLHKGTVRRIFRTHNLRSPENIKSLDFHRGFYCLP